MTFWLVVHVLTAIIGFGPVFVFPIVGSMIEAEPQFANVLSRVSHKIGKGIIVPVGLTQAVSGTILIIGLHINLTKNAWLGVAILLYAGAMLAAIFHQIPTTNKIVDLTAGGPANAAEAKRLGERVKKVGMVMTLALLTIIVLMVWKPGFAV